MKMPCLIRTAPTLPLSATQVSNNDLKEPLLKPSRVADILEHKLAPPFTALSLDAWVEREGHTCSHSQAREAALRIRAVQQDKAELLDLSGLHLHSVPPLIGCEHIKHYRLTGNYLMRVPDDLGELPNLAALGIDSNGLRRIPSFRKYGKLRFLVVGGNPVEQSPPQVPGRPVQLTVCNSLLDDFSRKMYRSGQRRLRLREFIARTLPCLPDNWLPPLKKGCPTFDGGDACDLQLRPFPFRKGMGSML